MERQRPGEETRNREWEDLSEQFDLAFEILEDEETRMQKLKRIVGNLSMRLSLFVESARHAPSETIKKQAADAVERLSKFQTLLSSSEAQWLHWKQEADALMEKMEAIESRE